MHCVLYARVSTDKQAEKDLSIPAQLQAMREYAAARGWRVAEEFVEPGASGTTAQRRELQRLLERVCGGEPPVGVVLLHKLDRVARNLEDHVSIRARLKAAGARLVSVVENVDESASGQLIENIMASIAQFYSVNLADEVRKGMRQKVLKGGWPHQPPRGYVVVRERGVRRSHVEAHPREGPLIRQAFEQYATGGYSTKALAAKLAEQGVTSRSGGPMSPSHLRGLLSNVFYAGRLRWADLDVEGSHPPLVPQALFDRVQIALSLKHRARTSRPGPDEFFLRGLAICAGCRGHMTAERHEGRWGYYRCGRNAYRKELCRARFCNAERAHGDIKRICGQVRLPKAIAESLRSEVEREIDRRIASRASERSAVEAERAKAIEKEIRLTEAFASGDVSAEAYGKLAAEGRKRRDELSVLLGRRLPSRLEAIEAADGILRLATSVADLYAAVRGARRQELLQAVFSCFVLGPEGVVGFTLNPPFDQISRHVEEPRGAAREALVGSIAGAGLASPRTSAATGPPEATGSNGSRGTAPPAGLTA